MAFEWDKEKEELNIKKHGVYFVEAVTCFSDLAGFRLADFKHSNNELRYYWVGESNKGRVLTTYYTVRTNGPRIIGSAEWRKYRRMYYERAKVRRS